MPITFACRARCFRLFMTLPLDHELVQYLQGLVGAFSTPYQFRITIKQQSSIESRGQCHPNPVFFIPDTLPGKGRLQRGWHGRR